MYTLLLWFAIWGAKLENLFLLIFEKIEWTNGLPSKSMVLADMLAPYLKIASNNKWNSLFVRSVIVFWIFDCGECYFLRLDKISVPTFSDFNCIMTFGSPLIIRWLWKCDISSSDKTITGTNYKTIKKWKT